MQAYPNHPTPIKDVLPFVLSPYVTRQRKHLVEENTRALAAIKGWVRDLPDRLHRTGDDNPNYQEGTHVEKRRKSERELVGDLRIIERTRHFLGCAGHGYPLRCAYEEVARELHRVLDFCGWWKPRHHVKLATGEIMEGPYLPEDTWGAANQVNWMVDFLMRLLGALPSTTDRATTRYRQETGRTTQTEPQRARSGQEWQWPALPPWLKPGREQPALPATS